MVHNKRLFLCKRLHNDRVFYFKYVEKNRIILPRFLSGQNFACWLLEINDVHLGTWLGVTENSINV